jgi:Flp pilus assembly pilin Flp
MTKLFAKLQTLRFEIEEGQTMAEYGVVLGVITVLAVAAFGVLGGRINDVVRNVATLF